MSFNSIEFIIFIPLVFVFYWFVFDKNLKVQNLLILLSSYVFYGWWDYRFLSLVFLSTIVDYIIGLNIPKQDSDRKQKLLLWCSILFNLGILGFFKYYNFFIDSWIDIFSSIGYEVKYDLTLNIILPLGISFYTFQTMSYTIDIYRRKLSPTKDFISFASYVTFFPQLVAGPIERASNLLPQFLVNRNFCYKTALDGVHLIIWGMFKKIVIADSLAPIVDDIFSNYEFYDGGILWLGVFYFGIQVYSDFSGYSDIAIGTSKLFGFKLMTNFNFPYFSRNIAEFWRRWHISLTNWFTEYLFIPLKIKYRNSTLLLNFTILIFYFMIIGFWHGANFTYLFFGIYHSLLLFPTLINPNYFSLRSKTENQFIPSIKDFLSIIITFIFVSIGWVLFRSESLIDAFKYFEILFSGFFPSMFRLHMLFYVFPFLILDYLFYKNFFLVLNKNLKRLFYIFLIIIIILNWGKNSVNFIYFQF